jgi:hypothetical protein
MKEGGGNPAAQRSANLSWLLVSSAKCSGIVERDFVSPKINSIQNDESRRLFLED